MHGVGPSLEHWSSTPLACHLIVLTYRCSYFVVGLLVLGVAYKLTILRLPTCMVEIVSSYLHLGELQNTFQWAISTCIMLAGMAQDGLFPTSPLACTWKTRQHLLGTWLWLSVSFIVVFRQPALLVSYLQIYLNNGEHCLLGQEDDPQYLRVHCDVLRKDCETLSKATASTVLWEFNPVGRYSSISVHDIDQQLTPATHKNHVGC